MQLIAVKAFAYGGRRLAPGDPFEAGAQHARVLMATGRAKAPAAEPETPPAEPAPAAAGRPARQYRRRDLQAET